MGGWAAGGRGEVSRQGAGSRGGDGCAGEWVPRVGGCVGEQAEQAAVSAGGRAGGCRETGSLGG